MPQKYPPSRNQIAQIVGAETLMVDGQKVDLRTIMGRRWRDLIHDLAMQLGDQSLSPSEAMQLRRAATLSVLCERDEARLIKGEPIEEENYRRNASALRAALIPLGLAEKSRDAKPRRQLLDSHAAAVLDATDADVIDATTDD